MHCEWLLAFLIDRGIEEVLSKESQLNRETDQLTDLRFQIEEK
jgi:hypothetical protein